MLYLLLLPPLIIIAAAIVQLASLPASFAVQRSRVMKVDRQRLFDAVRDLRRSKAWSPWLLHEPEAALSYSDEPDQEGGSYRWDGKHIGAGTLTHVRCQAPERIDQRLIFGRPFRARNDVWWAFKEQDGGTEVTWGMHGRMPFGLRFMVPTMSRAIAKDYDLGLAMLNGARWRPLRSDRVAGRLRFPGVLLVSSDGAPADVPDQAGHHAAVARGLWGGSALGRARQRHPDADLRTHSLTVLPPTGFKIGHKTGTLADGR